MAQKYNTNTRIQNYDKVIQKQSKSSTIFYAKQDFLQKIPTKGKDWYFSVESWQILDKISSNPNKITLKITYDPMNSWILDFSICTNMEMRISKTLTIRTGKLAQSINFKINTRQSTFNYFR